MKKIWLLAWKNVRLYRRRHFFTGVGLAAGFCALVLLGGYMLRMEEYLAVHSIFLRQVGHVSILKKDSLKFYFQNPEKYSLSQDEQVKVRTVIAPMLAANDRILPVLVGGGMMTSGCQSLPVIFTGIDPQDSKWIFNHPLVNEKLPELLRFDRGAGYWQQNTNFAPINISPVLFSLLKKNAVFEGKALPPAKTINCNDPKEVAENSNDPSVQIFSPAFDSGLGITDAVIAGLKSTGFTFSDETGVMLPIETAKLLLRTDNVSRMAIILQNQSQTKSFAQKIQQALSQAGLNDIQALPYTDESISPIYVGAMNFVYVMVGFFMVLVCGVVILSIANSFQIAFMERKQEFGTLRSIGFRPSQMRTLLLFEYIQLSLISFGYGGLAAFLLKSFNNSLNLRFQIPGFANDLQFKLEPTFLFSLLVALGMTILVVASAFYFADRQMKIKVIDLMKADL